MKENRAEEHKTEEVTPLSQKCREIAEKMVIIEELNDEDGHEFVVILKKHNTKDMLFVDNSSISMEDANGYREDTVEQLSIELEEIVKEINET